MSKEAKTKRITTLANKPLHLINETREKMRKSRLGKKASKEAVLNMKIAAKLRGISPETQIKLNNASHARKGIRLSDEVRKKMSISRTGEGNHNFGKTMSTEQKLKISNSKKGCKNPHKGNVTAWSEGRRKRFEEKKKAQKEGNKNDR